MKARAHTHVTHASAHTPLPSTAFVLAFTTSLRLVYRLLGVLFAWNLAGPGVHSTGACGCGPSGNDAAGAAGVSVCMCTAFSCA